MKSTSHNKELTYLSLHGMWEGQGEIHERFVGHRNMLTLRTHDLKQTKQNQHTITGCNIGSKTLLAERGKLPKKFTCPTDTSTCPATLLNKGEL